MAESNQKTNKPDDDTFMVGILAWIVGSSLLIEGIWHFLSPWDFALVWLAAAFIALVGQLVQAILPKEPVKGKKLPETLLWKAIIVGAMAFSLLGPAALLACGMWFTAFLFRSAKQRANRIVARA